MKKSFLLLLPLLLMGVGVTSCGGDGKPKVYDEIDVLTPSADAYSKKYDIKAKAAAFDSEDLCNNHIQKVKLVSSTDGDTARFSIVCKGENIEQAIRFYGIDTPETHHPTKGSEPWGEAAAQYTKMRLTNAKEIYIETGVNGFQDTYDRKCGYVWADGVLLNYQLSEIGLGKSSISDSTAEAVHGESILNASYYRSDLNGYSIIKENNRYKLICRAIANPDPNWDYTGNQNRCTGLAIESQICRKDKNYKYKFVEVGPTNPLPKK